MDALQYLLPSRDTASVFDVVLLDRLGLQLRPAFDYAFNLLIPRFAVPARALESVRNRAWLLTAVYAQLHCLSTYGTLAGVAARSKSCRCMVAHTSTIHTVTRTCRRIC